MTASRLALKTERKLRVFSAPTRTCRSIIRSATASSPTRTGNVDAIRDAVTRIKLR